MFQFPTGDLTPSHYCANGSERVSSASREDRPTAHSDRREFEAIFANMRGRRGQEPSADVEENGARSKGAKEKSSSVEDGSAPVAPASQDAEAEGQDDSEGPYPDIKGKGEDEDLPSYPTREDTGDETRSMVVVGSDENVAHQVSGDPNSPRYGAAISVQTGKRAAENLAGRGSSIRAASGIIDRSNFATAALNPGVMIEGAAAAPGLNLASVPGAPGVALQDNSRPPAKGLAEDQAGSGITAGAGLSTQPRDLSDVSNLRFAEGSVHVKHNLNGRSQVQSGTAARSGADVLADGIAFARPSAAKTEFRAAGETTQSMPNPEGLAKDADRNAPTMKQARLPQSEIPANLPNTAPGAVTQRYDRVPGEAGFAPTTPPGHPGNNVNLHSETAFQRAKQPEPATDSRHPPETRANSDMAPRSTAESITPTTVTAATIPLKTSTTVPQMAKFAADDSAAEILSDSGRITAVNHLTSQIETSAPLRSNTFGTTAHPDLPRHVAEQLAAGFRGGADKSAEIHLNPAELGRVRINMHTSDVGVVVSVVAERPETLDLLRRHADLLAQEFHEIGFGAAEFSFGQGGDTESDQDNRSGGSASGSASRALSDGGARLDAAMGSTGSTISLDRVDIRL